MFHAINFIVFLKKNAYSEFDDSSGTGTTKDYGKLWECSKNTWNIPLVNILIGNG